MGNKTLKIKNTYIFRITLLCLLLLSFVFSAHGAVVKMSKSKICHPVESPYYERTKNYTSYPSVRDCLNAGGRLPKKMRGNAYATQTNKKTVKETSYSKNKKSTVTSSTGEQKYKRSYFGSGWADLDHDGQDARQEALIAQSTAPVRFKSSKQRRVASGRWISPFTNSVIHDPSKIDIDHVVPLKWAWVHGANNWSQQKREQFANDPANLLSVEASLNRQKGAKGLDEWLPPQNKCQYSLRFLRISKKYKLNIPATFLHIREEVCR